MEFNKIEIVLEKYFQGETSSAEEQELTNYFTSANVAQHLEQYKPLFVYFEQAKEQKSKHKISIDPIRKSYKLKAAWLSIAATVVVLLGVGMYVYTNNSVVDNSQDLGSYDDPEVAFRETQKLLSMLSTNVNTGIESVQYIQVYDNTKNRVFNH